MGGAETGRWDPPLKVAENEKRHTCGRHRRKTQFHRDRVSASSSPRAGDPPRVFSAGRRGFTHRECHLVARIPPVTFRGRGRRPVTCPRRRRRPE
ncbi:hypothetical protein AGIG_G24070 [Arapaima gigas]